MRPLLACCLLALISAPLGAAGQAGEKPTDATATRSIDPSEPKVRSADEREKEAAAGDVERGWARASTDEKVVVSHHVVTTAAGQALRYLATVGTLTIRNDDGKPTASLFYVAYTLEGGDPRRSRPVTFFYNGGPGSSSGWLHMGSVSPVRVTTANPEYIRPAPYGFGSNPDTLLDRTDMVFLDAVGTGYSRPLGDTPGKAFWGVDQDADAFARAIFRYVTKFDRWDSPKFLYGESYGTTRSGALAWQLQNRGMALNGVILQSSILNYGVRQPGYDERYIGCIPSFAAAAWYHNKLANRPADLATLVDQARAFALGPYASALAKGANLSGAERDATAQQMSALTGLSPQFIEEANLRVDPSMFRKELLRDQRLTLGRYDARYTGVDAAATGESPDYDASETAISGAIIAMLNNYLTRDLDYPTDMTYRLTIYGVDGFKWDWQHKAPGSEGGTENDPDVALDLGQAMRTNPYLKVLSLNGYYDMATPFAITEFDLSHMMLEPAEERNIEYRYYPSGHMIYLNPAALKQLHADLAAFYDEAVASAASGTLNHAPVMAGAPAPRPSAPGA